MVSDLEKGMQGDENDSEHETAQYLTFFIVDEEYGVHILDVKEIRRWEKSTPLPQSPDYVRGVINLRGAIIPIIDLRERFGLPLKEYDDSTVIIVLTLQSEGKERTIGVVVDAVSDVCTVKMKDKKPPPEVSGAVSQEYVESLVMVDDKMVIILDINRFIELSEEINL